MFCVIIIFMRIDKLLCELNIGSRSRVKQLLKQGLVFVNGEKITKPETQVEEVSAKILCQGREFVYKPFVYYMMNKPPGVITATTDKKERTVIDVFLEAYRKQHRGESTGIPLKDIFPVGRLDKDTVGLLIFTNDGTLAHEVLSPRKHIPKKYVVKTDLPITKEQRSCLEKGVLIGDGEQTKPAMVELSEDKTCLITITEGKYHQVKRMFYAVGLRVIYLKRLSMGGLILDENLEEGSIRELTDNEVKKLCLKI